MNITKITKKFAVVQKETYLVITEHDTLESAREDMSIYIDEDLAEGTYEDDYYCIVDQDYNIID